MNHTKRTILLFLWVILLTASFWKLWGGSLREWDEALTAERSREMLVLGDYLTPHFAFQPDFNKPPLYYWLTMVNFRLFGINELSVRLWSVLFALGCAFLVYRIATRTGPNSVAGIAALFFLLSNPHWINKTREALLDSGLLFFMLSTIWFLSFSRRKVTDYLLAGLCLGLGMLIKGPMAAFALAVPLWRSAVLKEEKHSPGNLLFFALAFVLITAPWYAYETAVYGKLFIGDFYRQNVLGRYVTTIDGHAHGFWFPLLSWFQFAPVSLAAFAILLIASALFFRKKLAAASPFLFISLLLFGLISTSASKRDVYLIFIYPFTAIASGILLPSLFEPPPRKFRMAATSIIVILSLFLFWKGYDSSPDYNRYLKDIGLQIKEISSPRDEVLSLGIPMNTLLFYSARPIHYLSDSTVDQTIKPIPQRGRIFYLILKSNDLEKSTQALETLLQKLGLIKKGIPYQNKKYAILTLVKP